MSEKKARTTNKHSFFYKSFGKNEEARDLAYTRCMLFHKQSKKTKYAGWEVRTLDCKKVGDADNFQLQFQFLEGSELAHIDDEDLFYKIADAVINWYANALESMIHKENGFVHGDLHVSNIMADTTGKRITLIDPVVKEASPETIWQDIYLFLVSAHFLKSQKTSQLDALSFMIDQQLISKFNGLENITLAGTQAGVMIRYFLRDRKNKSIFTALKACYYTSKSYWKLRKILLLRTSSVADK
ncbi:MAG: phosphotransferase [Balneolales bacterium]|nr:phosphotransferase [Balneolales bacterium]